MIPLDSAQVGEAKALLRRRLRALRESRGAPEREAAARRLAQRPLPAALLPPPGGVIAG